MRQISYLSRHSQVVIRRCALDARGIRCGILPARRACGSLTDHMRLPAKFLLALLVALAVQGCARAQGPTPSPAPQVPMRHVLPNGVRVIIQEFRSSEVVAVQLWVRAGARDETASELGLAHYLEHMLFKGTTTRAKGFVERDVEGVGGRVNAGTSLDFTYYHVVLPAARAVPAIEMMADISVNSALDESELELEKKVVIEEMRRSEDTPDGYLSRLMYGMVFDSHPYARPVIG